MRKDSNAVWNALAATSFVTVIVGAVVATTVYLLIFATVYTFGLLPPGWEAAHPRTLVVVSGVISVPLTGLFAAWMFRRALAGERKLEEESTAAANGRQPDESEAPGGQPSIR